MNNTVRTERDRDLALIYIQHPSVNALSQVVRQELLQAIIAADESAATNAIVITGSGKHFVAGADIHEFDAPPVPPLLNDVLLRIENCRKPVIAAMHGFALGGGLELALACHYRCAAAGAKFGFPEVKLGLLPGSGGTQRLPRLIGVKAALELMLSGDPIDITRAVELGLVDQHYTVDELLASSLQFARMAIGKPHRRSCDLLIDVAQVDADYFVHQRQRFMEFDAARLDTGRIATGMSAQQAIIRCVEAAATQPFAAGLALSRRLFGEQRVSVTSRALRHLFFAERGSRPVAYAAASEITRAGVVGAGTMGAGIAVNMAMSGIRVTLVDSQPAAVDAGMKRIRDSVASAVHKGRITSQQGDEVLARVAGTGDFDQLASVQLVIEAVVESLAVKQSVFAQLDRTCAPDAILATNTSTLDVDAIAAFTRRPEKVLGLHFFSPANIMRLVEVVRGADTSAETLSAALGLTKRIGKLGIMVGNCFGFVGNRMLYAYGRENQLMLLEGATPTQIDEALQEFGMAMGPNAVGDLAGLDVGYRVRRERRDLPDDPRYYRIADLLVEAGRLGQKTGKGMFSYEPGSRQPQADSAVEQMIVAEAKRLGVPRCELAKEEIVDRCILALINEGARILAEGMAESPADIDAIWCNGYGFPRWRGGPMFYADCLGAAQILERIQHFSVQPGLEYWTAAALLKQLALTGQGFGEWAIAQRRVRT
jgi:3-hydroxyacyl-CoA dehydrogenase